MFAAGRFKLFNKKSLSQSKPALQTRCILIEFKFTIFNSSRSSSRFLIDPVPKFSIYRLKNKKINLPTRSTFFQFEIEFGKSYLSCLNLAKKRVLRVLICSPGLNCYINLIQKKFLKIENIKLILSFC